MTIVPLAALNLKHGSHLHGVSNTTSTVRTNEKIRAVLILETGAIVLTTKVTSKGPGNVQIDRTYVLHLSDTHYVEPSGDGWIAALLPPVEKLSAPRKL